MSKCIQVVLKDGSTVSANVANGVKKLDPQDVKALEELVAYVKARQAKSRPKRVCTNCKMPIKLHDKYTTTNGYRHRKCDKQESY